MHLNRWKSVLVAWANALEITQTTINFIDDLSPDFFVKLCSFLKRTDVSSLQEAVTHITDYYQSLVLGNEEDDNYVALLATAFLLFTSVHQTNDELCQRLCSVSNTEQAAIKSALEAFVDVQPLKITKDLMFLILAQLPDGPESCGNSPYLASSGSNSPGLDGETPSRTNRRSSRFKRVKHQLHMTLTMKNCLQDELDSARETISNLESVLLVKNQDIAQLRERCHRLLKDCEEIKSRESPRCLTPTGDGRDCGKCRSLERQISTYQDNDLQSKSDIEELKESLTALNKKISKLELEKRSMDDQLRLYEEQIMRNNDDISALKFQREDAIKNNKELKCIIEELRDAKSRADCSVDSIMPENLGNEVIDLQLCELRLALDGKNEIICERDEVISGLKAKLSAESSRAAELEEETIKNQTALHEMQLVNELFNVKYHELQKDFDKMKGDYQLTCTQLSDARKLKEDVEKQLKKSKSDAANLSEEIRRVGKDLRVMESLKLELDKRCCELKDIVTKKDAYISSLELESKRITELLQQEVDANVTLKEHCETLQSSLTEENATVCSLRNDILRSQLVIQEMVHEKEKSDVNVLSLQNEVERLAEDHKLTSAQLINSQKINISMEKELLDSQQRCTTLTEDLAKQEEVLQKFSFSNQEQGKELKEKNEKLLSLVDEITLLTDVIQQEQQLKEMLSREMEMEKLKHEKICCELQTVVAMKDTFISKLELESKRIADLLQQEVNANVTLKEQCETLQSKLTEESAKVCSLKNDILKTQLVIDEMVCEKAKSDANIISLQSDVEISAEEHKLTSAQLLDAQQANISIEQELLDSQQRCTSLTRDLAKQEEVLQKLNFSNQEQVKELKEKNEKLSSLVNEIAHLTAIIQQEQQLKEMLSREMEMEKLKHEKISCELQTIVAMKDSIINTMELEFKQITESLQQEVDANVTLKGQYETLQSTLTEESANVCSLKNDILRTHSVIDEMVCEKEKSDANILSLQNNIESLAEKHELTSAKLIDAQKINISLAQELHDSQQRCTSLKEDLAKQEEALQKLDSSYQEQGKELQEKNDKLSSLVKEIALLTTDIQQEKQLKEVFSQQKEMEKLKYEKMCSELQTTFDTKEANINAMKLESKRITELLQQEVDANVALKEHCETVESSLAEESSKVCSLKNDVLKSQLVIEEMVHEKEKSDAKILSLEKKVDRLVEEHKLTSAQLIDAQKINISLEQKLLDSQQRCTSLSEDLAKREESLKKLDSSNQEQGKELIEKIDKLSSFVEEIALLTADIEKEKQLKEVLRQQLEMETLKYEKMCSKLHTIIDTKDANISTMELESKHITELLQHEVDANVTLQEHCETLQSSLAEERAKVCSLKNDILKTQSVIEEMVQEKEISDANILSLEKDVERLAEEHKLTSARLIDAQQINVSLEQKLLESQQRCTTLTEDLAKQVEVLQKLRSSNQEQDKELIEKNEKLSSLFDEIAHLTTDIQQERQLKEVLSQQMEMEKLKYENMCSKLQTIVDTKDANINTMKLESKQVSESLLHEVDANVALKEHCETLQSSLAEESAKVCSLKSDILKTQSVIEEIVCEKEKSDANILTLLNDVERLVEEHKLTSAQLFDAQNVNISMERELLDSQQRCTSLTEDLTKQKEALQKLDSSNHEHGKELLEKNEKLSSLFEEIALLTADIQREQQLKEKISQELEMQKVKYEKMCCELQTTVAMKDANISSLQEEIHSLSETLQREENTTASLKDEIKTLQSTLSEKHTESKERLTVLEKELKEKRDYEEKLQLDLMALQKELNEAKSLASTLEEAQKSTEITKREYELEKGNTQTVIRSLQVEVERLTNENLLATSRATSLVQDTESLNRRLDNCCMDLDIKNETVLMMQTTIGSLRSEIGKLEAEMKEKDCALTSAQADFHNTKAAVEKYREEVQEATNRRIQEFNEIVWQRDYENETLSERIAFLSEELLQVSQTFNTEKTSLMDHAKNLEEMLENAKSAEERFESEIGSLKRQLMKKEEDLSHADEKMSLILDFHKCEKREWTTKNKFLQTQLDENKMKCDRLIKDMEEKNVEQLIGKISRLETESQELRDKLDLKLKDIQWYAHEMEVLQKSASNTMKVNKQLEEEVESLTKSKLHEVTRLEKEVASLNEKTKQLGSAHASEISAKLRQEYEEKLERLKAKMRKVYTEKVEAMMKYQTGDEKMFADEELRKEKQKRHALESKVRELSDQLLIIQEEKRALISNNIFRTPAYPLGGGPIANPAYESPPLHKTHSLDRLPVQSYGLDNLGADHFDQSCSQHNNLEQSFSSRRTSTSSNRSSHLPKGIGKVFPAAEEDGEVFDNRCLSDLKDGVFRLTGTGGDDRMSILQQRNSMCPPHLKSSYPVESQFFAPNAKDEEIKLQANAKANKENKPQDSRSVPGTPSKLRALFSGARRKH